MTEDEATTRWCPFSRLLAHTYAQQGEVRVETGYSYNRSPDPDEMRAPYLPDGASCIASACMAWRKTTDKPGEILERRDMGAEPPPEGWFRSNTDHPDTLNKTFGDWIRPGPWKPAGYCGLAGAPT